MTVRFLQPGDIDTLRGIASANGFEYPDFGNKHIVGTLVVTDEDGEIIVAGCAKQILEVYGWCAKGHHPATQLNALRLLVARMKTELRERGWNEVNAFLPEQVTASFGSRLARSFGFAKNLVSYWLKF